MGCYRKKHALSLNLHETVQTFLLSTSHLITICKHSPSSVLTASIKNLFVFPISSPQAAEIHQTAGWKCSEHLFKTFAKGPDRIQLTTCFKDLINILISYKPIHAIHADHLKQVKSISLLCNLGSPSLSAIIREVSFILVRFPNPLSDGNDLFKWGGDPVWVYSRSSLRFIYPLHKLQDKGGEHSSLHQAIYIQSKNMVPARS